MAENTSWKSTLTLSSIMTFNFHRGSHQSIRHRVNIHQSNRNRVLTTVVAILISPAGHISQAVPVMPYVPAEHGKQAETEVDPKEGL